MPAAIPDRYRLEVRLGRDGDIEEWLATDTSLDRPVLVRSLGPESSVERRREFVDRVSDAAKVSHPHLARVFAVDQVEGGAYSVSEWTGGASVADRVEAEHPIELPDFLPNASGLAGALAALHSQHVTHGAIDLGAISYSAAHAAKLGGFGRQGDADAEGDVRALSASLESALTGSPPGGPPPSERIDGIPRAIDRILRSGQSGELSASDLEKLLQGAPTPRAPRPETGATSRRLLFAALGLVVAAIGLVSVGLLLSPGGEPILPPPPPATTTSPAVVTTTTPPSTTPSASGRITITDLQTHDPFGGGGEHDNDLPSLIDGSEATQWGTEQYQAPLNLIKPGVGVVFAIEGSPSRVQLSGLSEGTAFDLYWSGTFFVGIENWSRVLGGRAGPGSIEFELPERVDGFWMIWLTSLPLQPEGTYYARLGEVRFLP
ncbi:MAG: hypothetical protein R3258_10325 [Acidimicrobiia bacterium]|nr:hypothetical protein [Acidimicrobiia bacterium]